MYNMYICIQTEKKCFISNNLLPHCFPILGEIKSYSVKIDICHFHQYFDSKLP